MVRPTTVCETTLQVGVTVQEAVGVLEGLVSLVSLVCVFQLASSSRPSVGVMQVEGSRRVTQSGV